MKQEFISQSPAPKAEQTILSRLEEAFRIMQCDRFYVASAYATVEGVRSVLDIADKHTHIEAYCWVLGLDDYFTHPKALELCRDLPASALRVASFSRAKKCIFHPKVMLLSSSQVPEQSLLVVGSANLTAAALKRNAEAVVLLRSETEKEAQELLAYWQSVWQLGKSLSNTQLASYRAGYDVAKQERKNLAKLNLSTEISEEDVPEIKDAPPTEAELDASQAAICWIEVGKIVGGRELEFVGAQAPFFGLSSTDKAVRENVTRTFSLSDNSSTSLRLKYRPNFMWRLELNNQVPEVAVGLKVGMERSPYVAVVTKEGGNRFALRFIRDDSAEYAALQAKSTAIGTLKRTSSRFYGWA